MPRPRYKTNAILLNRLEKEADRTSVSKALENYGPPEDTRYLTVALRLISPDYAHKSMGDVCRSVGLSYVNVMEVWRRSQQDVTLAVGLKHAPAVMNDVGEDARSRMVTCDKCDGEGVLERTKKSKDDPRLDEVVAKRCTKCDGKGKVRKMGDKDARNTLFTAIGLGSKGASVQVNQQFNQLASEPPETTFKQARQTLASPITIEAAPDEKSD